MDIQLIESVAKSVCRKTSSFDIFDDMRSEIILALLEGKIKESKQDIASMAWQFYRQEINSQRVYMDLDRIYMGNDGFVHTDKSTERRINGKRSRQGLFNIKYVERVYELRAEIKTFKNIGEMLGISQTWAYCQVANTLHLPIVHVYLKNIALKTAEIMRTRPRPRPRSGNGYCGRGVKNCNSKLNDQKVVQIRQRHANGEKIITLAKEFGVSSTVTSYAVHGKTWKHVSF